MPTGKNKLKSHRSVRIFRLPFAVTDVRAKRQLVSKGFYPGGKIVMKAIGAGNAGILCIPFLSVFKVRDESETNQEGFWVNIAEAKWK